MRKGIVGPLMAAVIIILIVVLAAGAQLQRDWNIMPEDETSLDLSRTQLRYLKEHDRVTIAVDEELAYLLGDGKDGYLQEYMGAALRPAGLAVDFVVSETEDDAKAEDADGRLAVVTKKMRQNHDGMQFVSPLFQMEGAFFLRDGSDKGSTIPVVAQENRLTKWPKEQLTCQGKPLTFAFGKSPEELVAKAEEGEASIIGDRSSVIAALKAKGVEDRYSVQEKELYNFNVSILIPSEESDLYEILNQCIHGCDRHTVSYQASEQTMDGDGPIYMKQTRRNTWLPVVIILLSVLIAFFIYYMANRNMYRELDERMDRLKASEKEMQTTFHGVGHHLAELSLDGTVTDMNKAFADSSGLAAMGRKIWEAVDLGEEDRAQIIRKVEEGAKGRTTERIEVKVDRKIFVVDIFPIEDARGVTEKLLFMGIDVTQERMAKRQMLQDNKMIAIGQLAAGIAHEIRNPLGIIRNYCYVLKNMDDPELKEKAISEIEQAVESSGAIINNLLDLSRISEGRVEEIDMKEQVERILALNESTFRKEKIDLTVQCDEPIRTWIAVEPFDMILLNLTSNAADAMKDGGDLTVTLEKGNGEFTMSVADTGTGIEKEALEEIFNPFYTTKGALGTGLGLFIVYNEVEKLEGSIDVASTPGEGTTFRVTLPLRDEPGEVAETGGEE